MGGRLGAGGAAGAGTRVSAIPDDVRELFAGRNYAHLATDGPKGPTSVPIWIDVDGDAALAAMDRLSQKYIGAPFPMRNPTTVAFLVEVDKARHLKLPFAHEG